MSVREGEKVLLRAYPPGRKFQPVYSQEVYEVVKVEDKGVTVRDSTGKTLRRHKDDVKRYFDAEWDVEGELLDAGSSCQPAVVNQEDAVTGGEDGDEEQPVHSAADALPAEVASHVRPQRQRRLPDRLRDFVVGKIRMVGLGSAVTSGLP